MMMTPMMMTPSNDDDIDDDNTDDNDSNNDDDNDDDDNDDDNIPFIFTIQMNCCFHRTGADLKVPSRLLFLCCDRSFKRELFEKAKTLFGFFFLGPTGTSFSDPASSLALRRTSS